LPRLKIVKVAVENTALSFDALFDYLVPDTLCDKAKAGCRVLVPFGRANVKKIGMIFEEYYKDEVKNLKSITAVLDSAPVMDEEHLSLAVWISKNTFCPIYEGVKVQLPSGMHLKLTECYEKTGYGNINSLSEEELRVYREIAAAPKPITEKKLLEKFGFVDDSILLSLLKEKVIKKVAAASKNIGDKTIKTAELCPDCDISSLTEKQKSVVSVLEDVGQASVKDICYFTGVTAGVLVTLEKKGVVRLFDREVMRISAPEDDEKGNINEIKLSDSQNSAYNGILQLLNSPMPQAALLYGVTGSGKTQVFLRLIADCVKMGKQAIVMVPEISLTPQTVKVFYRYFGDSIAVIHSGLSIGERYDQYKRIKSGEVSVVVGTRSAVFAPLENIGIIVMDEEQESTYKSESTPRYHAREVAKFRCARNNALLLLASATPSVDSFFNAKSGRYHLFELENRYGNATLPEVTIVDTSEKPLELRDSAFSQTLLEEIGKNLDNNEQTILLYNRRGYHTVASCADCKEVVSCPHCSIALTYHKKNNRLMCHYCGYSTPLVTECPSCKSSRMFYRGQGTQRVEDELSQFFPEARILRMDMDTSSSKAAHERQFSAFEKGEYDILVGTQMVAKGLNFPRVTLVGVLNADQTLYSNDFRAFERGFSLITQVVGRSGRGDKKGRAVIQSSTPQNPVIALASDQNYPEFFNQEITVRKAMLYPPFCDLCVVGFVSSSHKGAQQGAERFLELIKNSQLEEKGVPIRVIGPSPMNVVKMGGKYRYRLIIKCKNNREFRTLMMRWLKAFQNNRLNKDITVYADLNDVGNL